MIARDAFFDNIRIGIFLVCMHGKKTLHYACNEQNQITRLTLFPGQYNTSNLGTLINLKGKTKFKRGYFCLGFEKVIGGILKKPRNQKCVKSYESMSTAISIKRI